jgi:hypothetical protein
MNFHVIECEQRSPAWFQARLGLLTGSCAGPVIAERKRGTGELQKRIDLRRRLVCERLTGLPVEDVFETEAMRHGREMEAAAFAAYEARTGIAGRRVGFVRHNELHAGCSPDGFIEDENGRWAGIIELKAPKAITHLEYLELGNVPMEYQGQILHALWLTGADWIDFCSYDERFPKSLELFLVRIEREQVEALIGDYDAKVRQFLLEVDAQVQAMQARMGAAA